MPCNVRYDKKLPVIKIVGYKYILKGEIGTLFYRSVKMKLIGVLLLFIIPLISAQAKADDNKAKGYP